MSGEWNRRLIGIAVAGWGWDFSTGSTVSVTFQNEGLFASDPHSSPRHRPWTDITDMAVTGPGTTTSSRMRALSSVNYTDLAGSAINLGLSYGLSKATSQTTTTTYLTIVGEGHELTVFSDTVDSRALRWQLAPAFATWRDAKGAQRRRLADRQLEQLTRDRVQTPPTS